MDLPKQLDEVECSIFEPRAKRWCPKLFRQSTSVPKGFFKGYIHTREEEMSTLSFFVRIFPALLALLTGELCFHQYKATLVIYVACPDQPPMEKGKSHTLSLLQGPLLC